ncbi:MAG: peptidylprolyl isomerase [Alphaproteobacteria bacterium]|jgi:peptidyl-prolyl cis-trans isomerase C|nr:peptidylprolyl isomerase [Alphaproteobacteria bacterium]
MLFRDKVIALAAAAVLFGAVPALAAADTTVAIVNGTKIYKKDVDNAIKELGQKLSGVDKKEVFPLVVDQIINEKLLDDAATAAKITESKDYQKRLEVLKAQMIKQMYFERLLSSKVTQEQVKAAYTKFEKDNKGKVEAHARHILVPSEEEAVQAIKDLDAGQKFEDIAKKRSSGPNAQVGGDLGWFLKDEMIAPISDVVFKMKPGSYTKTPVKTDLGWHVIKVEDRRERQVPKFEQVEGEIRGMLSQQALKALVIDLRAKADVQLFDEAGNPVNAAAAAPKKGAAATDDKEEPKKEKAPKKDGPKNAAQLLEEKEAEGKQD